MKANENAYVTNVFYSSGMYVVGEKIFVLYSDGTYDIVRSLNKINKKDFRLKELRNKKTKREAREFILSRINEQS